MKRWSLLTLLLTLAGSLLLWFIVAVSCMTVGTTGTRWPKEPTVFDERRRLVLVSSLVGAALASAGVAYQAVLRNPLADPYLLGVSSGAALATFVWRLPVLSAVAAVLSLDGKLPSEQAFAFVGALASVGIVLFISSRRGRLEPVTLLLVGVIMNALNASLFILAYHLFGPTSDGVLGMFVGGIQTSLPPLYRYTAAGIVGIGWIAMLAMAGQLNAASVGDAEAEALGVRIQRLRWATLIAASLVTAAAVAVSGPIGFIGLICPHVARLIVGSDPRRLLPVATALGAALLASADAASRRLGAAGLPLLPVGVLTSLLGGPFFLLLLIHSRRRAGFEEGLP